MGRSALTTDASAEMFYLVNQANQVEARKLKGGDLQFRWPLAFGEPICVSPAGPAGRRVLIAGVEKTIFEHEPLQPAKGVVYLFEISGNEIDPSKLLRSVSRSDTLMCHDPEMMAAMTPELVVLALPGHIAAVDAGLEVKGVYQDDFEPESLSADEQAYLHLIVQKGRQRAL